MKKILILLFCLIACPAWAATYYVSPTGNDSNDGLSTGTPWLTVSKANSAAGGSTVLFQAGGVWANSLLNPNANGITYDWYGNSAGSAYPRINGSGSDNALFVNSRGTTTINHIDFENAAYTTCKVGAYFQDLSNFTMNNVKCGMSGSNSSAQGFLFEASGHNIINPTLNYVEITDPSGGDGLAMYHASGQYQGATFFHLNIHDTGGACMHVYAVSKANVVSTNTFPYGFDINFPTMTNCATNSAIAYSSGMLSTPIQSYIRNFTVSNIGGPSAPSVNGFQLQYSLGLIVDTGTMHTVITSVPDGSCIILDYAFGDANYRSNKVTVRNVTVNGCASGSFSAGISAYQATNSVIYNNYSYGNSVGFDVVNAGSTGNSFYHNVSVGNTYAADIAGGAPASTWTDNIFANSTTYGFRLANTSTAPTENYNTFYNNVVNIRNTDNSTNVAIDGTDLTSNPLFVSGTNYSLQVSSPARAAATNSPVPDIGAMFFRP